MTLDPTQILIGFLVIILILDAIKGVIADVHVWGLINALVGNQRAPSFPIPPVAPAPPIAPPVGPGPIIVPPIEPVVPDKPPIVVTPPVTPPIPPVPPAPGIPRFTGITTTSFAGASDSDFSKRSAYTGKIIDSNKPGAALPYHFPGTPPTIRVFYRGQSTNCPIVDVGPWNTHDPYWDHGSRPQAESGTDTTGRHTNRAGLDLTPGAWAALGKTGNLDAVTDITSWDFVSILDKGNVAPLVPAPVGPGAVGTLPIPTGDNHLKVLTDQQCRDLFGSFTYSNGPGGDIIQDPAWVAAHIVDAPIPQLAKFKIKSVKCHKLVAPWLIKAFAEVEVAGLLGTILSYDGLWVPRHINHNPSQGISRHSYGAAMDINANWNAYGTLGAKRGTTGSTWEIEPIFAANGFACGRWFGYPHLPSSDTDGMHFEWVGAPK